MVAVGVKVTVDNAGLRALLVWLLTPAAERSSDAADALEVVRRLDPSSETATVTLPYTRRELAVGLRDGLAWASREEEADGPQVTRAARALLESLEAARS